MKGMLSCAFWYQEAWQMLTQTWKHFGWMSASYERILASSISKIQILGNNKFS